MPTPRPGSNIQILSAVSDRLLIPVVDVDRTDVAPPQYIPASAVGVVAGSGAPTDYAAAVAASYLHNSVAANADLTFTALATGTGGNAYSVEVIQPVTLNAPLEVLWNGSKITINLKTDGAGLPVATTALEIKTAFDLTAAANYISCVAEGDGSGTVDALAVQSLAGGTNEVAGSGQSYLYVDVTTPALYVNTGTLAQPAWTVV